MARFINGSGFLISNIDYETHFVNMNSFDDEMWLWNQGLNVLFKETILKRDLTFKYNDCELTKTIIFYPRRAKLYLIDTNDYAYFINKYFVNYKIIERDPEFYSFQIPLPEIFYYRENSEIQHEDRYNVSIGRYRNQTYKNIEKYTLRFNARFESDFHSNNSDPIFQRNFSNIYSLSEEYKRYLYLMMNIDPVKVNVNNLITPYFLLSSSEIKDLKDLVDSIAEDIHEAMIEDAEESYARAYDDWFNSTLDDLNREAFENDPDNYWNID